MNDLLLMNGYGLYVWSAFIFTFFSFTLLYIVTRSQLLKERKKFFDKFGSLNVEKATFAKNQSINREILSNYQKI
jgi:heme exporter protein D